MASENNKTRVGKVVSDKMDNTIVVLVTRIIKHPRIGKYMNRKSKFMVDDPKNISKIGDEVKIIECRPISKNKHWRLLEVIDKSANN
ncbi:MAG: 30S ribosomal protein S17 [Candidatus Marinimicrobia bacterium]|nr:30S ribosomal protein S17 [Candidatus Neomarinimicrobiota bacterium]